MEMTVRAVVRDFVEAYAPDELELLDSVAGLSDAQITRLMRRRSRSTDQVGFGAAAEAVALVTPVVWLAVTGVAVGVVDRGVDAAADGITARLRGLAGRLRRRKRATEPEPEPDGAARPTVPVLSAAQLKQVHATVLARAEAAKMPEPEAEALADAVVSHLARACDD
ncbi:hypothetical protein RM844_13920 [Streptomyces sp. DSM 44915]|uniref:Uncharacterized protein n=1 Tax=Streptomyces chisholmiae TaxID=3075540 RepID=A0ABU2JRM2_9ACTN|nr:hypothetical protein [Streptomyces sp. DSM 44915]MDT0267384.1 hypothetical protein [Streptomyces sp. DSM 44915]